MHFPLPIKRAGPSILCQFLLLQDVPCRMLSGYSIRRTDSEPHLPIRGRSLLRYIGGVDGCYAWPVIRYYWRFLITFSHCSSLPPHLPSAHVCLVGHDADGTTHHRRLGHCTGPHYLARFTAAYWLQTPPPT